MGIERFQLLKPEWETVEKLGEGSFGSVYKCKKTEQGIDVYSAVKVISLPPDDRLLSTEKTEEQLQAEKEKYKKIAQNCLDEIRLLSTLKGAANVVAVEDFEVLPKTDGIGWDIFIRMELLNSFTAWVSRGTYTENDVVNMAIDICNALDICAAKNILHKDIKPGNILMSDFGTFKLGDFGIAKDSRAIVRKSNSRGTLSYLAPERMDGSDGDARSDLYSLGIVMYEMLNNNLLPFATGTTQKEKMLSIEKRNTGAQLPAPCNASPALKNIILKACNPDPAQRFASAKDMKNALEMLRMQRTPATVAVNPDATEVNPDATEVNPDKTEVNPDKTEVRPQVAAQPAVQPVQAEVRPAAKTAKQAPLVDKGENKKSRFVILVAILAVVVILAGCVVGLLMNKGKESVTDLLAQGSYNEAFDLYIEQYGRGNADTGLEEELSSRIATIVSDYISRSRTIEECREELQVIRDMRIENLEDELELAESQLNLLAVTDEINSDFSATTEEVTTEAPVTEAPVTEAPVTEAPVTEVPVTPAPTTEEQTVAPIILFPTQQELSTEPVPPTTVPVVNVAPRIVSASTLVGSVLSASNVNSARSFGAEKTIDGYYDSCWCVATSDTSAVGARIRFNLAQTSTVSGIMLVNGNLYLPEDDLYRSNGQLERFTLTFSDGSTKSFTASYNSTASGNFEYFTFDTPVNTSSITLTVDSYYAGVKYPGNVCIGEFGVY